MGLENVVQIDLANIEALVIVYVTHKSIDFQLTRRFLGILNVASQYPSVEISDLGAI